MEVFGNQRIWLLSVTNTTTRKYWFFKFSIYFRCENRVKRVLQHEVYTFLMYWLRMTRLRFSAISERLNDCLESLTWPFNGGLLLTGQLCDNCLDRTRFGMFQDNHSLHCWSRRSSPMIAMLSIVVLPQMRFSRHFVESQMKYRKFLKFCK